MMDRYPITVFANRYDAAGTRDDAVPESGNSHGPKTFSPDVDVTPTNDA